MEPPHGGDGGGGGGEGGGGLGGGLGRGGDGGGGLWGGGRLHRLNGTAKSDLILAGDESCLMLRREETDHRMAGKHWFCFILLNILWHQL